jgi:hypothetical protein
MDYMIARAYAQNAQDHTIEELDEAFDRLAEERDAAQEAIGLIRAEKAKRRDAELQELRAARKAKEGVA